MEEKYIGAIKYKDIIFSSRCPSAEDREQENAQREEYYKISFFWCSFLSICTWLLLEVGCRARTVDYVRCYVCPHMSC